MTDYSAILEKLPDAYAIVYDELYRAAYLGNPCPTNVELARIGGISRYPRWATDAVAALERAGLIQVQRGRVTRVVILASGQSTAGKLPPEAYRRENVGPPIPARQPERTPCTYCGVRADIGCEHSRRAA